MSTYSVKRGVSFLRGKKSGTVNTVQRFASKKSVMKKKDSRILAIASREIVRYHKTCYEGYTRAEASPTGASDGCGELLEHEYVNIKSETYQMVFDYIRSDVLTNEKIVRLTYMTELHLSYVSHVFGCGKIKLSSKKHNRRKLQAEFENVFFLFIYLFI